MLKFPFITPASMTSLKWREEPPVIRKPMLLRWFQGKNSFIYRRSFEVLTCPIMSFDTPWPSSDRRASHRMELLISSRAVGWGAGPRAVQFLILGAKSQGGSIRSFARRSF